MSYFLNTKFGFIAKVGKRSAPTTKGYQNIPEAFSPDLRRAVPFSSFSVAQSFAKDNAFEYWTIVNPTIPSSGNIIDVIV